MVQIVSYSEYQELMRDCGAPTYEPIATTTRRARVQHACHYGDTIEIGDVYERHICKLDGDLVAIVRHLAR